MDEKRGLIRPNIKLNEPGIKPPSGSSSVTRPDTVYLSKALDLACEWIEDLRQQMSFDPAPTPNQIRKIVINKARREVDGR